MAEVSRVVRLAAIVLLGLTAGGCATVSFDHPRTATHAEPKDPQTYLGALATDWEREHPGESGFFTLEDGIDALGARLRLIERAERTIDAQYFLIKRDTAGGLFAGKLLRAADRGVRVRLLLDDVFTVGVDAPLTLLDTHPNVEVRMFNPISRQGLKSLSFLFEFERANRRMHNKSFTVDGAATIVGGRNIADEYFEIHEDGEFADFEVLGVGPIAADVAETFDAFWNNERAVPIAALTSARADDDLDTWRAVMEGEIAGAGTGVYAKAFDSDLIQAVRSGQVRPFAAPATVVTDAPEKLAHPIGEAHQVLVNELASLADRAEREVIFLSPYFVPGEAGVASFRAARARGLRVVVITNSLASTNHVAVHSGYFHYREALLEAGVEIYEVRANAGGAGKFTLHTKVAIIDGETLFVGSLNLDPRSIEINTEMGVFIDSTPAAGRIADELGEALTQYTYRLSLDRDHAIEWHDESGPEPVVWHDEPLASWGRKFSVGLYQLLPIEDQL